VQTDRTIPNNTPDITTFDNGKRSNILTDAANPGERNVIKREAEKVLKYEDLIIEIQCMWNVGAKLIQNNNSSGKWNHLKATQAIPEQHAGKAQDQGTTENSHIEHRTHSAGSVNVEVQNVYREK
jgi:hypothetical protein